jgi:hypothetical protein
MIQTHSSPEQARDTPGQSFGPGRASRTANPRAEMTVDELRSRYEFLKQLTVDGPRTHLALDPTGAVVLVHLLDECSLEERDRLIGRVQQLGEADPSRVLEVLEVDGAPALVTPHVPGFVSLGDWLGVATPPVGSEPPPAHDATERPAAAAPAEPTPADPAPAAPADRTPATEGPGEFTRLFEMPSVPQASAQGPSTPPVDETAADPAVPASADEAPRDPAAPAPAEEPASDPAEPAPAEEPAGAEGPGEFTRLFEVPSVPQASPTPRAAPPPPPPPPPPPAPAGPAAPSSEAPVEEPGPPAEPTPAQPASGARPTEEPAATQGPGEFTRLFGMPSVPEAPAEEPASSPAPAPADERADGSAPDRAAKGEPVQPAADHAGETAHPGAPAQEPPPAQGPGEFTRLFEMPDGPAAPQGPPAAGPPPPPAPPARPGPSKPPPLSPPKQAEDASDGEFTRMFGRAQDVPPTSPFSWPAQKPPPDRSRSEPGTPATPAPRGPTAPDKGKGPSVFGESKGREASSEIDDSYLKRLHGSDPRVPGGADRPPPPGAGTDPMSLRPASPPPTPAPSGPSEFTRVISAGSLPPAAPSPPVRETRRTPPAPSPSAGRGVSRRGFLIGMSVVLVIALALVLYFALFGADRGGSDPGAEAPPGEQVSRVDPWASGQARAPRITSPEAGG